MTHTVSLSEQQALLGKNNLQGLNYDSPYYSGAHVRMQDQPPNSSDLDTTSSVGAFKSRSVLQQPSDDFYHQGIPIWRAALLVVNSALGAGILNFPQAYAQCGGIGTAITIQMVGFLYYAHKVNQSNQSKALFYFEFTDSSMLMSPKKINTLK